jgi:hypothetical protein
LGNESELVLGLWETFKDLMPAGKREDAAIKMLKILEDWVDLEDVAKQLHGEDNYLDKALEHYVEFEDDDQEDSEYDDYE